ncbi:MAG: hypothetical protein HYX47_04945 [Burkholderiales bacterium]|nr:hypothetical protein [Burkholderiales bacterium]
MNNAMEVRIDRVLVTAEQIANWEAGRARAVLRKLRRMMGIKRDAIGSSGELSAMRNELLRLKEECGRQRMRSALERDTRISGFISKFVVLLSGGRRKQCVVEIKVAGATAKQVFEGIDDLMRSDTNENRQSNLLACPDHYVLEPRGTVLEVIETTGGSPFPAQFFMQFGDESGIKTARDPLFPYQSVGTARASDGAVLGGVRHQFRDEGDGGTLVRLMVEFPLLTPNYMIRDHQWHLSCEFSHWLGHVLKDRHL